MKKDRRKKGKGIIKMANLMGLPFKFKKDPLVWGDKTGRTYVEAILSTGKSIFVEIRKFTKEPPKYPPEAIVSGTCMFSAAGIMGAVEGKYHTLLDPKNPPPEGAKIEYIIYNQDLSLYEEEALKLLPEAINAVAANETSIYMHVPLYEYYLYFYKLYLNNQIGEDELLRAYTLIKERASMLEEEFKRRIKKGNIFFINPLNPIAALLSSGDINLENIETNLTSDQYFGDLWRLTLSTLPEEEKNDLKILIQNLSNLSYTVAYLYALRRSKNVIAVEKGEELPIALNAKNYLQEPGTHFGGVYIQDLLLPPKSETGERRLLYLLPPQPNYQYYKL